MSIDENHEPVHASGSVHRTSNGVETNNGIVTQTGPHFGDNDFYSKDHQG